MDGTMSKPINLEGLKYGRLTAISVVGSHRKGRVWRCKCDCGGVVDVVSGRLRSGWTKSCGCMKLEHGHRLAKSRIKHGFSHKISEYNIWSGMKARCYNRRSAGWKRYGGRGIGVAEQWRDSFDQFLADVGRRPSVEYSLDRIDVDGDYGPDNCRWALQSIQQNNRRDNLRIEAFGEILTPSQWQAKTGIKASAIRNRLDMGWSSDDAVSRPVRVCCRG
jgi:hypothetical protein